MQKRAYYGLYIVIAILAVLPMVLPNSFYLDLAIRMAINAVIVLGLNLLIGFAGQRVIENTVREKLPEGFQRAEFLVQKGAIDMIVDRRKMREEIARLLALLQSQPADVIA